MNKGKIQKTIKKLAGGNLYDITPKTPNPKWYEFRKKLSHFFLQLAKLCYKENPSVYCFLAKMMTDQAIYGKSIIIVDPEETKE